MLGGAASHALATGVRLPPMWEPPKLVDLDPAARAVFGPLDMPSFAATKARINERAIHAIGTAVNDEIRAVSGR